MLILKRQIQHLILLTIALLAAVPAHAAFDWSDWGSDAESWDTTTGNGTAASPYLIETPQQLRYLSLYVNKLLPGVTPSTSKLYFRLANSINLGGTHMLPIGNGATPWIHELDGNGYCISNFIIDYTDRKFVYPGENDNYTTYGLFGYISGKEDAKHAVVKNLKIDRAVATQSGTANRQYAKVGILAGKIGRFTDVKNIAITNATINDGGTSRAFSTFLVGGLVGEISQQFSTYTYSANIKVVIQNISVEADIDIHNIKHTYSGSPASGYTEFDVGGIVGRVRRVGLNVIPSNTIFKGNINAPLSAIGPNYGLSRSNVDNTLNAKLTDAWSGEYSYGAADAEFEHIGTFDASQPAENDAVKSWFYDFNITYDGTPIAITADTPTGNDADDVYSSRWGTRPILPNGTISGGNIVDKTGTFNYLSQTGNTGMAQYQGVNRGRYLDQSTRASMAASMSTSLPEGISWVYSGDRFSIERAELRFDLNRTDVHKYKAELTNGTDTDLFTYRWYVQIEGMTNEIEIAHHTTLSASDEIELTTATYQQLSAAAGHPVGPNQLRVIAVQACDGSGNAIDGVRGMLNPAKITAKITDPTQHFFEGESVRLESYRFESALYYVNGAQISTDGYTFDWKVQNAHMEWVNTDLSTVIVGTSHGPEAYAVPTTFDRLISATPIDPVSGVELLTGTHSINKVTLDISTIPTAHNHHFDVTITGMYGNTWSGPTTWDLEWEVIHDDLHLLSGDKTFAWNLDYSLLEDEDWADFSVRFTLYSRAEMDPERLHPISIEIPISNLTGFLIAESADNLRAHVRYAWYNAEMGHNEYPHANDPGSTWQWYKSSDDGQT